MNQQVTPAIVLRRLNYGEADRIITVLTPEQGKVSLIARGVRRPKSKLAGGIELFSVSNLTYLAGRSDLGRLISARLEQHYSNIVKQLDRVQLGYELLKKLDKAIEDQPESAYFELMQQAFQALNSPEISVELIRFWFSCQLLSIGGHTPNLRTDSNDATLDADKTYRFDFDAMNLTPEEHGNFSADHIKVLRMIFADTPLAVLQKIQGLAGLLDALQSVVVGMEANYS